MSTSARAPKRGIEATAAAADAARRADHRAEDRRVEAPAAEEVSLEDDCAGTARWEVEHLQTLLASRALVKICIEHEGRLLHAVECG